LEYSFFTIYGIKPHNLLQELGTDSTAVMAESIPLLGTPCEIDATDEGKGFAKENLVSA
jgi:hypothetical protein